MAGSIAGSMDATESMGATESMDAMKGTDDAACATDDPASTTDNPTHTTDDAANNGVDEFTLQRRLIRLGYLLINRRDADLRAHGLTSGQSGTLLYFASHPGSSCRDLSEKLEVTHQAVQKSMSKLRDRGLLETRICAGDAREHEVFATAKGKRMARELEGNGTDAGRAAFSRLTTDERRRLADMVDRMVAALEDADAPKGSGKTVPDGSARSVRR